MMAADKSRAIASKTDDLCIILCFSNNLLDHPDLSQSCAQQRT
jgi:hypothetical protein